ncbi:MAG: hypothetical protein PHH26_08885 [Candidatus Thermoplasmatota archaeon]|nr:hypothetical protein [Candidatus Thermoplasmatota archaeon]
MAINREWHERNRMPKNPKLEQRIEWHLEHQKNCDCRPIPGKLKKETAKLKCKT